MKYTGIFIAYYIYCLILRQKEIINRTFITKSLGCSVYSVVKVVEELQDDNKIKLTSYGYKLL